MDILEHVVNSAASVVVALGGRGAVGKWLSRRAENKEKKDEALVSEVRAHGITRAEKVLLEARVEELERKNDEISSLLVRERVEWEKERVDFLARIEALEALVLKKSD